MEMGYNKTSLSSINAIDNRDKSISQHSHAEILLLDKSNENQALLYQLKKDAISLDWLLENPPENGHLPKKMFFLAGEVGSIDKKNKVIYMANKDSISYRYLIIANGLTSGNLTYQDDEFNRGLQTLIEALRIQQRIPPSFEKRGNLKPKQILQSMVKRSKELNKVAAPPSTESHSYAQMPEGPLFEVQL